MIRGTRVFFIASITFALLAGAFASAATPQARLGGPTAVISFPASGAFFEVGASISFDGSKSTGTQGGNASCPINTWAWSFGDGGTASGKTVSYSYAKAGSFTVTLTVTDDLQTTGSASITLVLAPVAAPQGIANQPTSAGEFNPVSGGNVVCKLGGATAVISSPSNNALFETGSTVLLDGSKSTGSGNLNQSYPIVTWDWTLGDGSTMFGSKPKCTYATAGSYAIGLTVTDSAGMSAVASVQIYVAPPAQPQAVPNQPAGGEKSVANSGGMPLLGPGGATATISSPSTGALFQEGANILFDGSKSTGSGNLNTTYPIVSWQWDFGDGHAGAGTTIVHAFYGPGSYTVTLTVTDSVGQSAFTTVTVIIAPPPQPQSVSVQSAATPYQDPSGGGMTFI